MKFVSRLSVLAVSAVFVGLVAVGQASAGGSTLVMSGNSSSSWATGYIDRSGDPKSTTGGHSDSLVIAGGKSGGGEAGGFYFGNATSSKKTSGGEKPKPSRNSRNSQNNEHNNGSSNVRTSATVMGGSYASAGVGN